MNATDHQKTAARFMKKVEPAANGCWNWTGGTDRKGYGKFSIGSSRNTDGTRRNSMVSAHRASYDLFVGAIYEGKGFHGTCVLHKCDNPRCVNPEHLFLGTNADNVHDMDSKGRRVSNANKGESHHMAKLSERQVADIKRMLAAGFPRKTIASDFNCCLATVHHIATGRQWGHVAP